MSHPPSQPKEIAPTMSGTSAQFMSRSGAGSWWTACGSVAGDWYTTKNSRPMYRPVSSTAPISSQPMTGCVSSAASMISSLLNEPEVINGVPIRASGANEKAPAAIGEEAAEAAQVEQSLASRRRRG